MRPIGHKFSTIYHSMTTIEAKSDKSNIDPRILSLFKPLANCKNIQVFLHGSWADNSTTPFSDIDDFIIIDDVAITDEEREDIEIKLKKIEHEFYKLDPIQHHGHWQINKSELNNYDNSIIPLFILQDSIKLVGDSTVSATINYSKTYNSLRNRIIGTSKNIELFYQSYKENRLTIYDLKRFVGSIALIPPLLYQLQGIEYTKKEAIQKANNMLSKESLILIQWASDLRNNWKGLIESNAYIQFKERQNQIPIGNWAEYAKTNSPIIDAEKHTPINISDNLIDQFISDCQSIIDYNSIQRKTIEDYETAYKNIEKYAIEQGATIVGKFGEIKHPGISDLDVFICLPDSEYKTKEQKIHNYIDTSKELTFFFTHPTVCISESMLNSFPYLHTVSNLHITYNRDNISIPEINTESYIQKLNELWVLLILPLVENLRNNIKHVPIRPILLRLKNLHTAIDNLSKQQGLISNEIEKTTQIRNSVLKSPQGARSIIEKEIESSYHRIISLINNYKPSSSNKSDYLIIGKKFVFQTGNFTLDSSKEIIAYNLPYHFFKIVNAYYCPNKNSDNDLKQYFTAYKEIDKISEELNTSNPFVFLLTHFIYIKQTNPNKARFYKILSNFPRNLSFMILKHI